MHTAVSVLERGSGFVDMFEPVGSTRLLLSV